MGFEILTQPQVFLAPITAVGGIQNGLYNTPLPPLYTSFYTWTSTSSVTATTFPLGGIETLTNRSGSYIVTVGGVIQSPTNYTVNNNTRLLTFNFTVNPSTEVIVTQIGTIASLLSVTDLTASNSVFQNINANSLLVTNLTALSAEFRVVDITQFELSGFTVLGNANIIGNTNVTNTVSALNFIIANNGTLQGSTSATSINIGALSARTFALIHDPANDGVDPILDIGETLTGSFSGFRVRYEEPTNRLIGSSRTGTTILTSFMITTNTGQVGISGLPAPGQALTVVGSISATGDISTSGGNLSALNIFLTDNGSFVGATSATSINIGALSARTFNLIHTPANDGVDPILDIGETTTTGFSGFRVRYDENSNRLLVQTLVADTSSNSVIIDRATGQVGISAVPNQALTVTGNISATGNLTIGPGITALNLPTPIAGSIEYSLSKFFTTHDATGGRGLILAPHWVRLNANRTKPNNNTTLENVFDATNDTISLIANTLYHFKGMYILNCTAASTTVLPQIGFSFSQTPVEIFYRFLSTIRTGVNQPSIGVSTVVTATTVASPGSISATNYIVEFEGYFRSNATTGGTFAPQFAQSVAGTSAAPTMVAGTWFMLQPIGGTGDVVLAGSWS